MAKQRHTVKSLPLPVYLDSLPIQGESLAHVTLIVPTTDILLTTVALPNLSHARLLQALPYALEDRLIDDVAKLHFATGPRLADGSSPVAVVSNDKMQTWLDAAQKAGLSLSCIIPDICTLPLTENHWTIDITDADCIARTGVFSGFSCPRDNLATYLEAALNEAVSRPISVNLRFFTHYLELTLPAWPDIAFEKNQYPFEDRPMLARDVIASYPIINLLQNNWPSRLSGDQNTPLRLWQIAGGFVVFSITLLFALRTTELIALQRQTHQMKGEISAIYHKYFPKASSVVAPKTRLGEKLRQFDGQRSDSSFMGLLTKAAEPIASQRSLRLTQLDYRNKQLQISLTAPSFENIDTLIRTLSAANLSVKQQTASTENGIVNATLLIRSVS